jgi:hypothetical protein
MKTHKLAIGLLLLSSACASRHTILTVPAVSMTRPSVEPSHVIQPGDKVSAEYCQGDDPITSTDADDANIGLIDEAVMKAQRQSGAEYIGDVTISQKGGCVLVEGIAMK